jgi:serine/threonine protein kinase
MKQNNRKSKVTIQKKYRNKLLSKNKKSSVTTKNKYTKDKYTKEQKNKSRHNKRRINRQTIKAKRQAKRQAKCQTQNKTKNTTQDGGVKLGKGSFGCVVKPSIKCKPLQNDKNLVSKIVLNVDPTGYKDEMVMMKHIRNIDPQNKYLISFVDECALDHKKAFARPDKDVIEVNYDTVLSPGSGSSGSSQFSVIDSNFSSVQSEDEKKRLEREYCLVDPKQPYEYRNQIQIYGGTKILPILKNPTDPKYSQDFSLMQHKYKELIFNMLRGCKKMHDNEFIHRDIKFDNMVYSVVNGKPVFKYIDFNLGDFFKGVPDEKKHLSRAGTPGYIPIDFFIYYYINLFHTKGSDVKSNSVRKKIIDIIIDKYIEHMDIVVEELDSHADPILEGPVALIEEGGKKKLRRQYPTGRKPKLSYLSITNKHLYSIYKVYSDIVTGSNELRHKFCYKKYDGIVYKTDIFALGIIVGLLKEYLKIHNQQLMDLIKGMTHKESMKRLTINQCIKHPVFADLLKKLKENKAKKNK